MSCVQVLGPKTYAGKQMAAVGNHRSGREVLDIHLLKAAAHEAVALGHWPIRVWDLFPALLIPDQNG